MPSCLKGLGPPHAVGPEARDSNHPASVDELPPSAPLLPRFARSACLGPLTVALREGMTAVRLHSNLFRSIPGGVICFVLESKRLSGRFRFISVALGRVGGESWAGTQRLLPISAGTVPITRGPAQSLLTGPRDPPLSALLQMAPEKSKAGWLKSALAVQRAHLCYLAITVPAIMA